MVFNQKTRFILAAALAVLSAVVTALDLGVTWTVATAGAATLLGVFGIQAATPEQIVAKLPAHVAATAGVALTAAFAIVESLRPPVVVQVAVVVVVAVAGALGIQVTAIVPSKPVLRARQAKARATKRARGT